MGTYLNPGNKGFQAILRSEYVDKTRLIALVNTAVGTRQELTCISRQGVLESDVSGFASIAKSSMI